MQKRSRGAIGLALALVAALVPSSHAERAVAAAVPGTTCQVFPANNIWNTDISRLPVNARQSTAPPIAGREAANPSPSGLGGPRRPQILRPDGLQTFLEAPARSGS